MKVFLKWLDKIWCHPVWVVIKWPFGVVVLGFVLWIIIGKETNANFERDLIKGYKSIVINTKEFLDPGILKSLIPSESQKVKNLK